MLTSRQGNLYYTFNIQFYVVDLHFNSISNEARPRIACENSGELPIWLQFICSVLILCSLDKIIRSLRDRNLQDVQD